MRDFIKNLQNLPEGRKKVVFFIIMGAIALTMIVIGIFMTKSNLATIGKSLKNISLPKIDIPEKNVDFTPGFSVSELEEALDQANNLDAFGNSETITNTSEENNQAFEIQE